MKKTQDTKRTLYFTNGKYDLAKTLTQDGKQDLTGLVDWDEFDKVSIKRGGK